MHPHAYKTGVVGEVQYGLGPSSLFPGVHFTQIKRGVCSGLHFSVCATAAGAKRNKKNFAGMKILCGSGGVIILDPGNKTATEGANSHVSSIIHPVCNRPLLSFLSPKRPLHRCVRCLFPNFLRTRVSRIKTTGKSFCSRLSSV